MVFKHAFLRDFRLLALLAIIALATASGAYAEGQDDLVQYIDLKPSFVLNYDGPSSKLKFAKIDVSVRVNTRTAATAVEHHMPALRNLLVLMFSRQTEKVMGSNDGREQLRAEALQALQDFLQEESGGKMAEDLLFTNFVVQR
ncbi:flagellar basal body-associated protein FliL [Hahella sp. KA22]|uniref:flagellar basal body-associated FliL family protein n=1 Tax=Hahella sp. KA22 TaxID=1628392 RepID=UPI000FDDFE49|nr:flagellar basal body-associated FliL family protein [Hahella sp. KA22]AZZ94836.1 flagellar basal body-associated protein FliL [Hahella sp. KA22]QAY58210.1 flagellar basal body-associated protein FliL [Hahella sp. KA22]